MLNFPKISPDTGTRVGDHLNEKKKTLKFKNTANDLFFNREFGLVLLPT